MHRGISSGVRFCLLYRQNRKWTAAELAAQPQLPTGFAEKTRMRKLPRIAGRSDGTKTKPGYDRGNSILA
ncbi:MAG: hypothetical protein ACOYID_04095 [Eubacteriales bacterium]